MEGYFRIFDGSPSHQKDFNDRKNNCNEKINSSFEKDHDYTDQISEKDWNDQKWFSNEKWKTINKYFSHYIEPNSSCA